jgi:hypothetical protein
MAPDKYSSFVRVKVWWFDSTVAIATRRVFDDEKSLISPLEFLMTGVEFSRAKHPRAMPNSSLFLSSVVGS